MTPEQYLKINDLWNIECLRQHAQHNSVYVIESPKIPNVVMLHYKDEVQYDNKWNAFSRMARGLILDMKNQKVLAHPFDKFFNMEQMPETSYDTLKGLGAFETTEKLDGSMCILFRDPNSGMLLFTTKGSFASEHGTYANEFPLPKAFWTLAEGYNQTGTLVFELIAKPFQIVIDYKKKGYEEGLYLIGYRDRISNKLATPMEVVKIADCLGIPTFKTYSFNSLDSLLNVAKDLPVLEEGFVLRFSGDFMVKVKGTAYLAAHRFISHLSDRNILEAVAEGSASTLAELAPEEYRQEVLDKIDYFQKRVAELESKCYTLFSKAPQGVPRKEFAIWVNSNVPSHFKGFIFKLLDGQVVNRKQMFKVLEEIDDINGVTKI